jgi:hypothetical protein
VLGGHAVDHLGDQHRLADPGAAEQADLAARHVRGQQVDDLDAGLEHARRRLEGVERRRGTVDLPPLHVGEVGLVGVERRAPHVPHVPEHPVAHRDGDPVASVAHGRPASQAVGRLHADRPDAALAELLGDFGEDAHRLAVDLDFELERRVQVG